MTISPSKRGLAGVAKDHEMGRESCLVWVTCNSEGPSARMKAAARVSETLECAALLALRMRSGAGLGGGDSGSRKRHGNVLFPSDSVRDPFTVITSRTAG